jgi:hypothetical protein
MKARYTCHFFCCILEILIYIYIISYCQTVGTGVLGAPTSVPHTFAYYGDLRPPVPPAAVKFASASVLINIKFPMHRHFIVY